MEKEALSKLIIVRGLSGSGKSTWSRKYAADNENTLVVNRDKIREMLFGSEESFGVDEDLVTVVQDATIRGALAADWNVVVDNTNVMWETVEALAMMGSQFKADVEIVEIDCTLEEAKRRNASRAVNGGRFVPEHVIDMQHANYMQSKGDVLGA